VAFLVITFFKDQIRVVFFNVLRGVVGAASFPEISRVLSAKILKFFWGRWLAPAGWVFVVVLLLFVCFLVPLHGLSGRAGLGWLGWLLAGLAGFAPGWVGWVGWLLAPGWVGWVGFCRIFDSLTWTVEQDGASPTSVVVGFTETRRPRGMWGNEDEKSAARSRWRHIYS